MIGKKINQLATELAPTTTDLTIIGDPVTGVSKKITLEQLGAIFGGAVSFYTTLGDFPVTGVIDIIYCAKDTKKLYLWSGSAYVEVFPAQSLLDTYQLRSEKGVSNGYASLDSGGKVPISQLPSSIMEYKGTWNAATNTPTLANGTGDTGDVYICNVAGTVNFGAGPITFAVGDYVIYSGTIWQRSSGAVGTVTSVAVSRSGDALAITGSPITTSGTINIGFAGTGAQYIKGDGTLATFPSIISQAQNLITEVYNNTGATLTKGTIVYINGGQGNLPTVTKALATSDATSAQTYGVVQTDITNMNNGYVVVEGRLSDLDTQAYANGTQLYLSPTTAGTWTSTKPYAPNHLVYVGIVVRSHPTQGVVEVKIMNGFEMDELHNVAAQNPDNNDILQYKTATSLWTKVAGTTSNIAEGSNLYYTDARSRASLSFTAGSGAYNSTTGVITIPTNTNQLTNGAAFITLASLSAGAGISYNNTTGVIASTITQYTDALARAAISLTTTGTSGAATYNNTTGVLNIPQYQTALTNPVTGTGTTNYLPKFTGTSTIGNSAIYQSGNYIGIGTTAPIISLQVRDSGNTYSGHFSGNDQTNGVAIGTLSSNVAIIQGYTRTFSAINDIVIQPSGGNLGLGVTPSAWAFFKAVQVNGGNSFVGYNNQAEIWSNSFYDGASKYYANGFATRYAAIDGRFEWYQAPSGTAGNAISFTQAMTLNASGFLGIGTTTPEQLLDIKNSGGGTAYALIQGQGRKMYLGQDGTGSVIYSDGAVSMNFSTNGSEKMRLNASGNLSIGNTNDTYKLDVTGTARVTSNLLAQKVQVGTAATINDATGVGNTLQFANYSAGVFVTGSADSYIYKTSSVLGGLAAQTLIFQTRSDVSGGGFAFVGGSTPSVIAKIDQTGAATFSSSVTASSLTVGSLGSGSDAIISLATNASGSPRTIYYKASTAAINFTGTGGSDLMTLTNGGNVGIGTTSPAFLLTVSASQSTSANNTSTGSAAGINNLYIRQRGFSNGISGSPYTTQLFTDTGADNFEIYNAANYALVFGTNATERMRITSGGAVEIQQTIKTGAPTNGTAQAWRLGNAVSGSVSTNHYLIVSVNGTTYSIPALNGLP